MQHRNLSDNKEIIDVITRCQWCHVAMADSTGKPYVVPMNFGFDGETLYFHSAQQGKKISILKENPDVCINFSIDHHLRWQNEDVACSYSMKYRSVLCYGKVEFIEDPEQKVAALHIIMKQFSGKQFKFNPPSIREVSCWKVKVERFEGRVYGY